MDRDTAEKLMTCYSRLGALLNDADPLIRSVPDVDERTVLLRSLGEMMGDLWVKLQLPIVRQFPDLDPDGDRFRKPK